MSGKQGKGFFFNKMKEWNVKISEEVGFVRELFFPDSVCFSVSQRCGYLTRLLFFLRDSEFYNRRSSSF